jgi:hypothetical protein
MEYRQKKILASILCYIAAGLGILLGIMWLYFGWRAAQPAALKNPVFNPILMIDGVFVIIASTFVAMKSKVAVLLITAYALIMEVYLQGYQIYIGMGIQFKPYFPFELLALIAAIIGVFWWQSLDKSVTKR